MTETKLPTVVPMLAYENASAAIEFLTAAFGFTERFRLTDDDGRITHAELAYGDGGGDGQGVVMLVDFGNGYESPATHVRTCETTRRWMDTPYIVNGVFVQVTDVRAHFDRAKAGGATMLSEVSDTGHGILYRAADPEGHRWMFSQPSA
ncbi:VOC family protein [Actinopolymorpha sp. NPDC004070]|uniref:VOC family protein n=1 Tax=Actinopolymorpha sp. NPDC004070 TaxID=3154548 RepID=UPI0033BEDEE1